MTPIDCDHFEELASLLGKMRSDFDVNINAALAAGERSLRAVIEASKEENWQKPLYFAVGYGSAQFESIFAHRFRPNKEQDSHGFDFFRRALTGEEREG